VEFFNKYWKENIAAWEDTFYADNEQARPTSLLEGVAGAFRKRIHFDQKTYATKFLNERLKGKVVLDIGCGSGYFCSLMLQAGAKRVIGVDISPDIVKRAQHRFEKSGVHRESFEFVVGSVTDSDFKFPEADIITSLGLVEYLEVDVIKRLLQAFQGKKVLFLFHMTGHTVVDVCHFIYRKVKRYPYYKTFTYPEIERLFKEAGFTKTLFLKDSHNTYIYGE
jgi:cyclopropane fatty-acyl-phospholipid synthase-like methyltransferase